MKNEVLIDGIKIKLPHTIKQSRYNVTKSTRLANGSMQSDLIAQKNKFFFTWNAIDSKDLKKILDIIWYSKKVFFKLTVYDENGVKKDYTVYAGEIPVELARFNNGVPVYKNVDINFIEK